MLETSLLYFIWLLHIVFNLVCHTKVNYFLSLSARESSLPAKHFNEKNPYFSHSSCWDRTLQS